MYEILFIFVPPYLILSRQDVYFFIPMYLNTTPPFGLVKEARVAGPGGDDRDPDQDKAIPGPTGEKSRIWTRHSKHIFELLLL